MFSFFMTVCIIGGMKKENGRDTIKPIPQPDSHAIQKWLLKPTLMAAMATDMHSDIMMAMHVPKNNICRTLKKTPPFDFTARAASINDRTARRSRNTRQGGGGHRDMVTTLLYHGCRVKRSH
jgi:hypothetical protein